jgi:hypothetical protein
VLGPLPPSLLPIYVGNIWEQGKGRERQRERAKKRKKENPKVESKNRTRKRKNTDERLYDLALPGRGPSHGSGKPNLEAQITFIMIFARASGASHSRPLLEDEGLDGELQVRGLVRVPGSGR